MSKGRNTTVVGIRLPDEVVNRLKSLARKDRQTMTELLKPVITDFTLNRNSDGTIQNSPETKRKILIPSSGKIPKISPNSPCPCGALHPDGKPKKYKHCCGKVV